MKANWLILNKTKLDEIKNASQVVDILLKNRGIKDVKRKKEFINPINPQKISLDDFGLSSKEIKKVFQKLEEIKISGGEIIIYGDYDCDGICGTAILWESIYETGIKCIPYIPERFSEGYGIKAESVKRLKKQYPQIRLIITVDNGIAAKKELDEILKMNIDVVVTDHHEKEKKYPSAYAIVHTTKISGSGVAWVLSREIRKHFKVSSNKPFFGDGIDLAAMGTIADQLTLVGLNRSICFFGLKVLNSTQRPGLISLFQEARIIKGKINSYTVGFMIAPRLNSTGRLTHAIESLRLLCTKKRLNGQKQAIILGKTNYERQKIVDDVVSRAQKKVESKSLGSIIIISDKSYHEGIIGLAASKLVEVFYRPSIVISKGKFVSKASCRSIVGFNIIENIRKLENLIENGGGHPMAAGFSIKNKNIVEFTKKMSALADKLIDEKILVKNIRVDAELPFTLIGESLVRKIEIFEPTGYGNPTPNFLTRDVQVLNSRSVGSSGDHLSLSLKSGNKIFNAIGFGLGSLINKIGQDKSLDIVYAIDENEWNGNKSFQLKIKDIDI